MSYSNKPTSDYEAENFNGSLEPGIYDGELVSITKGEYKDGNGIVRKPLVFTYKTVTGEIHAQNEIEQTEEDKQDKQVDRIGYLLTRFVDKELMATNNSDSWESYREWVVKTLGDSHKGVAIEFKVVGNVYNGKGSSRIPSYKGQVVRKDAGVSLSFSDSERRSNSEYYALLQQKADEEATGALPGSSLDGGLPGSKPPTAYSGEGSEAPMDTTRKPAF